MTDDQPAANRAPDGGAGSALATPASTATTEARLRRQRVRATAVELAEAYALVGLIAVMAVFFSVYGPTSDLFPTGDNIKLMVAQQAVIAVVALAAVVPLVAGEWDLSVGANAGLTSVFVASAMSSGWSVPVALALGLGIGLAVGIFNAVVVTTLRVEAVIPTLGTSTILFGIVTAKTGGLAIVSDIPTSVTDFGSGSWAGVPRTVVAMLIIALVVYYLLGHTPLGRYLYAVGSNRSAAALVGINLRKVLISSFVIAGLLAGIAGALQVARSGGGNPNVGESFTLPALAAAFLSAASIKPGRYNVWGTLVAIFFLAVLNNGLNLAGAPNYVSNYVNGAALIIGIGLSAILGRRRATA